MNRRVAMQAACGLLVPALWGSGAQVEAQLPTSLLRSFGNAASLSGWSDANYIEHGSAAALDDMTVGAVAFWLFTTSDTARQNILSKSGNVTMELGENATPSNIYFTKTRATISQIVNAQVANFANYAINKWLFVVVNFDTVTDGNNTLWIGDLDSVAAEPSVYTTQLAGVGALTTDAASNLRIGRHATATGRQFVGPIAEIWVFNKNINSTEREQLRTYGAITDSAATLLHGQYGMNGATGAVADLTGNGNTGTVTGTLTVGAARPGAV